MVAALHDADRYYSLFTLGMLVMFECTVVMQRQRNLRELRSLQTPKQRIHVYRGGKWEVSMGGGGRGAQGWRGKVS
jgi:magnesium-transporting ATPase (P-type)